MPRRREGMLVNNPTESHTDGGVRNGKIVLCKAINVRMSTDKDNDPIDIISLGHKVVILEDVDDIWSMVEIENGTIGYIMRAFIEEC